MAAKKRAPGAGTDPEPEPRAHRLVHLSRPDGAHFVTFAVRDVTEDEARERVAALMAMSTPPSDARISRIEIDPDPDRPHLARTSAPAEAAA